MKKARYRYVAVLVSLLFCASNECGTTLIDAVSSALENHPNMSLYREQTIITKEGITEEKASFDITLGASLKRARSNTPLIESSRNYYGLDHIHSKQWEYQLTAEKQFQQGPSLITGAAVTQSTDDYSNTTTPNSGTIFFNISAPLLRGAGRQRTTADLRIAMKEDKASRYDLHYTASQVVLNVISFYWNYLAAEKNYDTRVKAVERAEKLLHSTKGLVKAGEYAPIDTEQSIAHLATSNANKEFSRNALFQAWQNLALAMGLSYDDFVSMTLPTDSFPIAGSTADSMSFDIIQSNFLEMALKNRTDLLATAARKEAAFIALEKEIDKKKHTLNLDLDLGYAALDEGAGTKTMINALYKNRSSFDASAQLTYQYPLGNRSAKAGIAKQQAEVRKQEIRYNDLSRTISSDVEKSLEELHMRIASVAEARKASEALAAAVNGETIKFTSGISTVFELTNLEAQLIDAEVTYASALKEYAIALASLRHTMGTLIAYNDGTFSFDAATVTTIDDLIEKKAPLNEIHSEVEPSHSTEKTSHALYYKIFTTTKK